MKLKEKENKHQLFTIYENARKTNSNIFWGGFSNEQETKSQHASCLPFMKMPGKNELSTIAANACQKKFHKEAVPPPTAVLYLSFSIELSAASGFISC
jgi:hypothetical protein